eukprot:971997-Rhodomonas_salina.1
MLAQACRDSRSAVLTWRMWVPGREPRDAALDPRLLRPHRLQGTARNQTESSPIPVLFAPGARGRVQASGGDSDSEAGAILPDSDQGGAGRRVVEQRGARGQSDTVCARVQLLRIGASTLLTDVERQLYHCATQHYAADNYMPMP